MLDTKTPTFIYVGAMSELKLHLRDRSELLLAAGRAAEALERRCDSTSGPTVTISRDELAEVSEQFQRVTALLTIIHLAESNARHRKAGRSAA
ncbi:MAG TPA: hypothetical protein VN903_14335 [Polyangia bacterium]|nr:hypothetical protein [Polyangia bacterium]